MNETPTQLLETILHQCAQNAPQPWYPSDYALATGWPREQLDPFLDRLRLGGHIELTDWVAGKGQGYRLTAAGVQLLQTPKLMALLQTGHVPVATAIPRAAHPGEMRASIYEARREAIEKALGGRAGPPVVTYSLVIANVAVFLVGFAMAMNDGTPANTFLMGSTTKVLDRTGAVSVQHIVIQHEWWRLLTCCFVHIGLLHLGMNMYFLWVVGPLMERLWGSVGFLILYLIAGLGGSCAMIWTMLENKAPAGAGASGALWGILASLATWIYLNRRVLHSDLIAQWRRQLIIVVGLNLALTFGIPGISAGAHIGGGLVGLVTAFPLDWIRFGGRWLRMAGAVALLLIPIGSVGTLVYFLNQDKETVAQLQTRSEQLQFAESVEGPLRRAIENAEGTIRDFSLLYDQAPARRTADHVKATGQRLTEAQLEIRDVLGILQGSRSYRSLEMRQLQQATVDLLLAWLDRLTAAHAYLTKGLDAKPADELEFERSNIKVQATIQAWNEAYRQATAR